MPEVTARIEIPTRTILKVLLVLAVLWLLARIGPVLYQLFAGILLAMTLYPPVARLQRRGFPKGRAIATVFGIFVLGLAAALWFLIPHWIDDGEEFWENLPEYVDDGTAWLERRAPWLVERLQAWADAQSGQEQIATESGDADAGTGADVSTGTTDPTGSEVTEGASDDGGVFDVRAAMSASSATRSSQSSWRSTSWPTATAPSAGWRATCRRGWSGGSCGRRWP
jgi:hypothetical protein